MIFTCLSQFDISNVGKWSSFCHVQNSPLSIYQKTYWTRNIFAHANILLFYICFSPNEFLSNFPSQFNAYKKQITHGMSQ